MATVANIDWPKSRFESSIIQQSELVEYVDLISATHINAVMFQARTAGDAFYNSTIEPWSKYATHRLTPSSVDAVVSAVLSAGLSSPGNSRGKQSH